MQQCGKKLTPQSCVARLAYGPKFVGDHSKKLYRAARQARKVAGSGSAAKCESRCQVESYRLRVFN